MFFSITIPDNNRFDRALSWIEWPCIKSLKWCTIVTIELISGSRLREYSSGVCQVPVRNGSDFTGCSESIGFSLSGNRRTTAGEPASFECDAADGRRQQGPQGSALDQQNQNSTSLQLQGNFSIDCNDYSYLKLPAWFHQWIGSIHSSLRWVLIAGTNSNNLYEWMNEWMLYLSTELLIYLFNLLMESIDLICISVIQLRVLLFSRYYSIERIFVLNKLPWSSQFRLFLLLHSFLKNFIWFSMHFKKKKGKRNGSAADFIYFDLIGLFDNLFQLVLSVWKNMLFTPIVLMTVLGIVANFWWQHEIPGILKNLCGVRQLQLANFSDEKKIEQAI